MSTHFTPSLAWAYTLNLCLVGNVVSPRGLATRELEGPHTLKILDPTELPLAVEGRDFKHVIGAVEGLSLIGQVSIPEIIIDRVSAFRPFMKHSVFWGAYGPRVAGHLGQIVDLLRKDPDSRQAVLTLFDASRDLGRSEQVDLPCTLSIQFKQRREHLEMWVAMRSNDVWLGLPYDLMQFSMLQVALAQDLDLDVGPYYHTAGSMHLYERNVAKAEAIGWSPAGSGSKMFPGKWWGGDGSIASTASRARRILLNQSLDEPTNFERWLIYLMNG